MNTFRLQTYKMQTTMKQINFNEYKHKNSLKSKLKMLNDRKSKNIKDTTKVLLNISKGDIEFMKDFHEEMKKCCDEFFQELDESDVTVVTSFDIEEDTDDFFTNN